MTDYEHWRDIPPLPWAIDAAVEIQNHIDASIQSQPLAQRGFGAFQIPAREIAQLITLHAKPSKPTQRRVELTPEGWWVEAKAYVCLLRLGRERFIQLLPLAINAFANDMRIEQLADEFNVRISEDQSDALRDIAARAYRLANGEDA